MATKLRSILVIGDSVNSGKNVVLTLYKYAKLYDVKIPHTIAARPTVDQITYIFKELPLKKKQLFLYREPRQVKAEKSRYRQKCIELGLSLPGLAIQREVPRPVRPRPATPAINAALTRARLQFTAALQDGF